MLNFETSKGELVEVFTGISFVSAEQARLNLETELSAFDWSFEKVHQNARNIWNELLSKIEISGGTETDKIKFYTNLYRAFVGRSVLMM
ncbi:MAG: glycoside hydrolase family 92 protein [Draconibacterium sp.]|nr:glycoside hydrolase family 92 protein [Draconibacterium sp.]